MRIEGADGTHFEGPVTTDARSTVDGGSGPHQCDGTNKGSSAPVPTVGAALATASERAPFSFAATWSATFEEYFLTTVQGEQPDFTTSQTFWSLFVDGTASSTGMCEAFLHQGEDVLWAVTDGDDHLLTLSGPASGTRGDTVTVSVKDRDTGQPVPNAYVGGTQTSDDGTAAIALNVHGTATFKASKPGMIRSNALIVTVNEPGVVAGTPRDRLAPAAKLLGITDRQVFAKGKGPRTIRASAPDPSGLTAVKLRLTRRIGGRCFYFSGKRAKLERTRCGRGFFFKVGEQPDVSYLLPQRLGPGRYVLDLAAVDRAGNRSALARGTTRVVFTVR
jgi:hypothetical protein